jgi:hypothetical protein
VVIVEATIRYDGPLRVVVERTDVPGEGLCICAAQRELVGAEVYADGNRVGKLVKPAVFDVDVVREFGSTDAGVHITTTGGEIDVLLEIPTPDDPQASELGP